MLLDAYRKTYKILEKHQEHDGQGGFITTYTDKDTISAVIVKNRDDMLAQGPSTTGLLADKKELTETFTVYVDKGLSLPKFTLLKDTKTNAIFRIITADERNCTPQSATFQLHTYKAERLEAI